MATRAATTGPKTHRERSEARRPAGSGPRARRAGESLMPLRTPLVAAALAAMVGSVAFAGPAAFPSRVPYEPLVAKLEASGGSPKRILHVRRAADLDQLETGRRYKFALDTHGTLAVAPLPADAPSNEYVHPILAGGGPVRTAGGIRVDRANGKLEKVVVDQDSKAYCPTHDSLSHAVQALTAAGVPAAVIETADRPPQCAPK